MVNSSNSYRFLNIQEKSYPVVVKNTNIKKNSKKPKYGKKHKSQIQDIYSKETIYFLNIMDYIEKITNQSLNFIQLYIFKRLILNTKYLNLSGFANTLFTDFASAIKNLSTTFALSEKNTIKIILDTFVSLENNNKIIEKSYIQKDFMEVTLQTLYERKENTLTQEFLIHYFHNLFHFIYVFKNN